MKKRLLVAVLLIAAGRLFAQSPQQVLMQLRDSFPQERIHIHFDKELYMAGETIWFKAYLFSGFVPSDLSSNFIVELTDANNNVILQKKLPVLSATATGEFNLPDTLSQGNYQVRAYTPWMLNFDNEFVFRKSFYIYKPSVKKLPPPAAAPDFKVTFFPEGGDLVGGVVNVVAFKATDRYGIPVAVKGKIVDEAGSEIAQLNAVHDGMGNFGFMPIAGQRYVAEVEFDNGATAKTELPPVKENGWALQVREEDEAKKRIILSRPPGQQPAQLLIIGQMQQQLVFEQTIQVQAQNAVLSLDTRKFPSGILQLTILATGRPVAERLIFVNNNDFRLALQLKADSISMEKKSKNVLSFALRDSIAGSISVAVVDEEKAINGNTAEDIVSRLLLSSDLKGYIHNPSFYFATNDKATRALLDLVMMTNGWRRFKWEAVLANKFPDIRYHDQGHIQISGTVFSSRTKKPVEGGEANFFLRTKDSLTDFFQANIEKDGRFWIDNLVYNDSAQFSFQLNSKKNKEKELYIELDKDTVDFGKWGRHELSGNYLRMPPDRPHLDSLDILYDLSADTSGNYKILETVTVTAKKNRPLEELNKRYSTGLFSSMNMVRILDLVNNDPGAGAQHVFQYIQGRIGGVRVVSGGTPPSYTVYNNRAMSLSGGPIPVPLFLDEFPATSVQLQSIPMNQVAMIKYFQTGFMGNPGSGSTSALVVYTRKSSDMKNAARDFLNAFAYPGYSPVREFYSPDYEEQPSDAPDRRITLLWQPNLKADPETGKYIIRFFTADNTKKVKVVVEGFTADGKLIREVKRF